MGLDCPPEEAQKIIDAFKTEYKAVAAFLKSCKQSVITPGYLVNPYGRYRAFNTENVPQDVLAAMQREGLNFTIQSTVADTMSQALVNLHRFRDQTRAVYHIILSIHDAIILEVPGEWLPEICERVFPQCMVHNCRVPKVDLEYKLGDYDIHINLGAKPTVEELLERNVPRDYAEKYGKAA